MALEDIYPKINLNPINELGGQQKFYCTIENIHAKKSVKTIQQFFELSAYKLYSCYA